MTDLISAATGKALATALALTLAGGAAAASANGDADAAAKAGAKVSIQTEEEGFSGFVRSSRSSCHAGRKVTLYRKSGKNRKKAGSDIAQPNQDGSQWSISVSRSGKYYAAVKATKSCKGAKSKTRSIELEEE